MKNYRFSFYFILPLFFFSLFILSCEKETDNQPEFMNTGDTLVYYKVSYNQNNMQVPLNSYNYTYNSNRLLSKVQMARYTENGQFTAAEYDTFEYNPNNILLNVASYYNSANEWKTGCNKKYTYPNDTTEIITYEYSNSEAPYTETYIYNNKLLKKYYYHYGGDLYNYKEYLYNTNNTLKNIKYYNSLLTLLSTEEFSYPSPDKTIMTYTGADNKIYYYLITTYENSKLQNVREIYPDYAVNQEISRYEYDGYGRITKEYKNPVHLPFMSSLAIPTVTYYYYSNILYD